MGLCALARDFTPYVGRVGEELGLAKAEGRGLGYHAIHDGSRRPLTLIKDEGIPKVQY